MHKISFKYSILLAAISGLITALTFPTMFAGVMLPNLGFIAWFSMTPLFVAIYNSGIRKTFIITFVFTFVFYSVSLFWLYTALNEYGKLSPAMSLVVLMLMMLMFSFILAVGPSWAKWVHKKLGAPLLLLFPLAWITITLIKNYFPFGGFPWNSIAYTQYAYPEIIQIADFSGIYGLGFLIILTNVLFAEIIVHWKETRKYYIVSKAALVIFLLAITIAYGWFKLETIPDRPTDAPTTRIALIQGNIPQEEKWDMDHLLGNLASYSGYMKTIKNSKISLAIWPESAYPFVIPLTNKKVNPEKMGLNPEKEDAPWLFFGSISIDEDKEGKPLFNSSYLVNNKGEIVDKYHKVHLVPFGEYVPLRDILFFARKLVSTVGDFLPGSGFLPIKVKGYEIGPLICYEDVFPEISREMVRNGAQVLVTITNDAWYGWSSAPWQHLAISVFRSVENRRYMLRAANTGVSAVINHKGKIELESKLFTRGFMATSVPILSGYSVYDKIGDLFAYVCVGFLFVLTIISFWKKLKNR